MIAAILSRKPVLEIIGWIVVTKLALKTIDYHFEKKKILLIQDANGDD